MIAGTVLINQFYYFFLALFAGAISAHRLYRKLIALRLVYLFLDRTGIPSILAITEGWIILSKPSSYGDILYL
ncbi:hypothetical protein [Streptococcus respiraculi]|uniref:hypothetical protein n=1 Tax=Streptococcus respiraculi TaxID=2021971 RepID=UPI0013C512E9|nr:hypothetical protein [Streptococcus respiraculi]